MFLKLQGGLKVASGECENFDEINGGTWFGGGEILRGENFNFSLEACPDESSPAIDGCCLLQISSNTVKRF